MAIVIYLIIGLVWMLINEAVNNWVGLVFPREWAAIEIVMYVLIGVLWPIHVIVSIWTANTQPWITDYVNKLYDEKHNEKKD